MGSVSVLSCRCCMFVSCVHPVAVLNAAFCMTCSLLMLVEDAMSISFCLPHLACAEMLWMCVLYVSFGSKVRPRTFGCIAMGSALLCILCPDCSYILQGLA